MAKQIIVFEHGGPVTGDSGERGDSTEGIDSVKPNEDGESAVASNFNRPGENLRQRTERLRDAGEDNLYLQDSDMRWIISAGRADGMADGEDYPEVIDWDYAAGTFTIAPTHLVIQPLNTPKEDYQETKSFTFPNPGPATSSVDFYPTHTKRAYNHANLIRIVWVEADPGDISGGYCEAELSGDPEHIVTITVRDDGLTQTAHVDNALVAISAALASAGIDYHVGGVVSTYVDYSTMPEVEYELSGTFERELHYLTKAVLDDFFTTKSLVDGDTLAIWFEELVEADPGTDGRRQAVPSNSNTEIGPAGVGELFLTSEYPERIPLAIPICKRIGRNLFFLDGTVVLEGQSAVFFGENGKTVERLTGGGITIASHANAGKPPRYSEDRWDVPADTLQSVFEDLQAFVNNKASLQSDEAVAGEWTFSADTTFGAGAEFQDGLTALDTLLLFGPDTPGIRLGNPATWTDNIVQVLTTLNGYALPGIAQANIYQNADGIYITQNCYWNYTTHQWNRYDPTLASVAFFIGGEGYTLYYQVVGDPDAWAVSAWSSERHCGNDIGTGGLPAFATLSGDSFDIVRWGLSVQNSSGMSIVGYDSQEVTWHARLPTSITAVDAYVGVYDEILWDTSVSAFWMISNVDEYGCTMQGYSEPIPAYVGPPVFPEFARIRGTITVFVTP